jgi:hypothetical protein
MELPMLLHEFNWKEGSPPGQRAGTGRFVGVTPEATMRAEMQKLSEW